MSEQTTLLWYRLDLRVDDHPPLFEACKRGRVVPVFVWAPGEEAGWPPGGASRWWLHHSLAALQRSLAERGSALVMRQGETALCLHELASQVGATHLYFTHRSDPAGIEQEQAVCERLEAEGVACEGWQSHLLASPEALRTGAGSPYRVFTPYYNAFRRDLAPAEPLPSPKSIVAPASLSSLESLSLDALELLPRIPWDAGIAEAWEPGEAAALARARDFIDGHVGDYPKERDFPALASVSRLSPYLHFGEIGPRRLWALLAEGESDQPAQARAIESYRRQLVWREFAHYLLYHYPHLTESPLRPEFDAFPWEHDLAALKAWQRGQTGYPIVDAGMRELWTTGWMHNRVRMIVASFLIKDLMIDWREGARWFWDTLVDADMPNNSFGWQWTAGCGADAAPYFRIFNPVSQGERFDPEGDYITHWCPELARLPRKWLHKPWQAPQAILDEAGIELGKQYPRPIVDHAIARNRALAAYDQVKGAGK